ncbi:nodulin-related protein 1-like [Rhododendron vialii]|uniref:nodulin-related protein 1-like n=1 Tax=Rhododendron vialii TaxID=182163 RepID=UPI00265D677E|nr:nodulin-related protein 1-like [Rhododendron vialii]
MDSPPHHKTTSGHHHQPKTSSELFSSAKVLAEAGQATYSHGSVDKEKVAGAASDLLGGARQYGNLEGGQFGQYIEKAETYLDKYESPDHSSAAGQGGKTAAAAGHGGGTTTDPLSHSGGGHEQSEGKTHSSSESGGGHGQSEGGYGEYFKVAEGFLKKSGSGGGNDSGGQGKSEGGSGDYLKMAQGFFNK